MTSLVVQSEKMPLPINLSSLTATTQMNDRQFYDFCLSNPELRIERSAAGEIIVMPPAFSDTGNRNSKISQQISNWADEDGTGEGFDSSAGFTFPNGAMRSPDAAWILKARWNALSPEEQASFAPIAPDFVVELRSSSDRLADLQQKVTEYMANGVRLGLLIDRQLRQVWTYRPNLEPEILEQPEAVTCEPEMPGFVLKMTNVW
jgi:Uma2 family endonuclease